MVGLTTQDKRTSKNYISGRFKIKETDFVGFIAKIHVSTDENRICDF